MRRAALILASVVVAGAAPVAAGAPAAPAADFRGAAHGALPSVRSSSAAPSRTPIGGTPPEIVNGVFTSAHPAVGALLRQRNGQWGLLCTATLIGCRSILTAAHCVCYDTGAECQAGGDRAEPGELAFFLQNAGPIPVESVAVHPGYLFPVADVAVLRLAERPAGSVPLRIARDAVPTGTEGEIVGFGRSGGPRLDYGLKREGRIVTAPCGDGVDESSICWNFVAPVGPPGDDSNTCHGDSGGPLIADLGAGRVVAGVTSGGYNPACLADDLSIDASVARYRAFIRRQVARDSQSEACSGTPGEVSEPLFSVVGQLSREATSDVHAIEVPDGARSLHVAMNASEEDRSLFRLLVRHGSPPTAAMPGCRAERRGQFSFCAIDDPAPGTWYARIRRARGGAPYQLTATVLHSAPTSAAAPAAADGTSAAGEGGAGSR